MPARPVIFIGLNVVRALSLIGLILVFSSSIFVLAKDVQAFNRFQSGKQTGDVTDESMLNCDYIDGSTVPNQAAGIFWAVVNRLLIIIQVFMLFLSELGWPASFFERFFPVLGPNFGLGALGIFQCLIGATILSHHVDDFTLVAAFFLFSIGCLNMLLGLIFRERAKPKRSISSWRESKNVLPSTRSLQPSHTRNSSSFIQKLQGGGLDKQYTGDSWHSTSTLNEKAGYGFGRQGEKAAAMKGYLISKPLETVPRYTPSPSAGRRSPSPPRAEEPKSRFSDYTRYSTDSSGTPAAPSMPVPAVPNFQSSGRRVL